MFRAGATNPYDDVVAKTTDENLTGENWELILNMCDKVQDEGEMGARNVVAAILKRLTHRNANVQLYTLTLAESLSKNCGLTLHRELASKAFTAGLEKLVTDRTTHIKVRNRVLGLIEEWKHEFEPNPELGIMEECYNSLKTKSYRFDVPIEPPPEVDDEAMRREEEELQRVLQLSMQDKGGQSKWSDYTLTSGAAGPNQSQSSSEAYRAPPAESGYVPASAVPPQLHILTNTTPTQPTPSKDVVSPANPAPSALVTRVRALHSFEPTEAGELAFERGDVIRVVDRGYKDWWRGQLRGRTGIFPVNYVEPLPEPTPSELAREMEQEAAVFSKAADVDKLLNMLKETDPTKDNLADNEEIQELYRSCMTLRPKIVKLIDKYNQKRADLVTMNETFVRARSIFDQMMEESLARHSQVYDRPMYGSQQPGSVANGPQPFGWNQPGYEQPGYNTYSQQPPHQLPQPGYSSELYNGQPINIYPQPPPAGAYPQQTPQQGPPSQPLSYGPQPQASYTNPQASGPQLPPIQPLSLGNQGARPPTTQPSFSPQPQQQSTPIQPQSQVQPQSQQIQTQVPTQPIQPQAQIQAEGQPQPQASQSGLQRRQTLMSQAPPQQSTQQLGQPLAQEYQPQQPQQQQPQAEPQPQVQATPIQNTQTEPPYKYDPNMRYADSNVQAWAQYYAQGGKDPTGAVYFISVPGVKEPAPPQLATNTTATTATVVNPNPNPGQSPTRRQSLMYSSHGATGGGNEDVEEDLPLQNPYDRYGAAFDGTNQAPGLSGPGYGASYGLTRDMAGMDIKG